MANKLLEQAVEARLRARWSHCDIFVENELDTPPTDGSPYLMLQFPVARDQRWALNKRFHQQDGAFRVVIHLGIGIGTDRMRDWGEEIAAIFRGERFSGATCDAPQPPGEGGKNGTYYWAAVVVPFLFHYSARP